MPHIPLLHAGIAPITPGQTLPHIPQCVRLVRVSVSQPFDATPSQSP
jgi:hypothetical protein